MGDKDGRFILVSENIDGNSFTLLNVYAPPGSDINIFQKITNVMVTETEGLLICGGDLNVHLKPKLGSSGKIPYTKSLHRRVKRSWASRYFEGPYCNQFSDIKVNYSIITSWTSDMATARKTQLH